MATALELSGGTVAPWAVGFAGTGVPGAVALAFGTDLAGPPLALGPGVPLAGAVTFGFLAAGPAGVRLCAL